MQTEIIIPQTTLTTQRGVAIWLFGLSGSGKTTIANLLAEKLRQQQIVCYTLDGDQLRHSLHKDLGFSPEDRAANIKRAASLAKEFTDKNVVVICSFITPLAAHRMLARQIIGDRYFEVFVDAPLWICEERDVKGLYKKARNNEILQFTGISAPFEPSDNSWLHVHTDVETENESADKVLDALRYFSEYSENSMTEIKPGL